LFDFDCFQGKVVATSMQDEEAQQVMYAQLEDLANRAAAMVCF
jgi:hypothetical protein